MGSRAESHFGRACMGRRDFIRYAACGLSAIVLTGCGGVGPVGGTGSGQGQDGAGPFDLSGVLRPDTPTPHVPGTAVSVHLAVTEALVEMVDKTPLYSWIFAGSAELRFPSPVIVATSGKSVTFHVTNTLDEPHEFRVVGAGAGGGDVDAGLIPIGETRSVTFDAPDAGTYLYLDPRNAPFNRLMGLYGVLMVLPDGVKERTAVNTPYTKATSAAQALFDDLGAASEFPGDPWIPIRPADHPAHHELPMDLEPFLYRTRLWVLSQLDPKWHAMALAGANAEPGGGVDLLAFKRTFRPEYFVINGRSGQFSAHAHDTTLEGFIGEPMLVRIVNAGLQVASLHLHANHPYVIAVDNHVMENVVAVDSMTLSTLEADAQDYTGGGGMSRDQGLFLNGGSRVDWLVPFVRPEDIPGDKTVPLRDLIPNELRLVLGDVPQSPLRYPMHDHMEMSQTAIGGNYPQGLMTDIVFLGDLDKQPFPH